VPLRRLSCTLRPYISVTRPCSSKTGITSEPLKCSAPLRHCRRSYTPSQFSFAPLRCAASKTRRDAL
jgi:hypothetical protein